MNTTPLLYTHTLVTKITKAQRKALKQLARERRVSVASLIRNGIETMLSDAAIRNHDSAS